MKNLLFITIAMLGLTISLNSCSKDDDSQTTASITVLDDLGEKAPNTTVYAYTSSTWESFGDDEFFADKIVATNSNGVADFILDDISPTFFSFDSQETVYFSVHYTYNGGDVQSYTVLTFEEFDDKSSTIYLD